MASLPINNPRKILRTLDSYLEKETGIVLFGRAALALGYGEQGAEFGTTQDVDAILPSVEMTRIDADTQFWSAIASTNKELEPSGLYLSHLFTDEQVILTPNWLEKIIPIRFEGCRFLKLSRPSSVDLILTKMMRNDREDIRDIRFILRQEAIGVDHLSDALSSARLTKVPEIQGIFSRMQPTILEIAREIERAGERGELSNDRVGLEADLWGRLLDNSSNHRDREKDRELEP